MYPIFNECPVCRGEMIVTTMQCRECDSSIQGRFIAGPFANLSLEQLEFVELFVRNEGKINRMEVELGLSYPTIRNRLHEIIKTLGYEPGIEEPRPTEEERRKILDDLEKGKIDSSEAMHMLQESEVR